MRGTKGLKTVIKASGLSKPYGDYMQTGKLLILTAIAIFGSGNLFADEFSYSYITSGSFGGSHPDLDFTEQFSEITGTTVVAGAASNDGWQGNYELVGSISRATDPAAPTDAVPEPGSILLAATAICGTGIGMRRKVKVTVQAVSVTGAEKVPQPDGDGSVLRR
jgi:PEP-CTERM motif